MSSGTGFGAPAAIAPEAGGKVKKNTGGFPRGEPRAITATHIGHDDALAGRIAAWRSRCVGSRGGSAGTGAGHPDTHHFSSAGLRDIHFSSAVCQDIRRNGCPAGATHRLPILGKISEDLT